MAPLNIEDEFPDDDPRPIYDRGLQFDTSTMVARRQALRLIGGAGLIALVGCSTSATTGGSTPTSTASATTAAGTTTASTTTSGTGTSAAMSSPGNSDAATGSSQPLECLDTIPEETAGPFPGDGTNGPDVLTEAGALRSDITQSFGSSTTVATGVPLTITLNLQQDCAPLAGAAVYIWHCDQQGRYSLYSQGVTNENYLRGVQAADAAGSLTFTSIFPGCYSGRWPHIHFEVYPSLAAATDAGNAIATSQIALPQDTCELVYATDGYSASVRNLSQISLSSDNVFGDDDAVHQLGSVDGDVSTGLHVTLDVAV